MRFISNGILLLITFAACGQKSFDEKLHELYKGTVPLIQAEDLKKSDGEVILLDTRTLEEFEVSHLKGAQLVDYESFNKKVVKDIPKEANIVVYCSVGYRSERIGEKLIEMGYSNVHNLYGGIFDWKNQSKEVVNKHEIPTDSVHTYNFRWSKWLKNGVKVY